MDAFFNLKLYQNFNLLMLSLLQFLNKLKDHIFFFICTISMFYHYIYGCNVYQSHG